MDGNHCSATAARHKCTVLLAVKPTSVQSNPRHYCMSMRAAWPE
jgi:hypothetical protein